MLLRVPLIWKIIHRNVSALYIAGDKANQAYVAVQPWLDFKAKLDNKQKLEQNILRRKLNIDLNELYLLWSTHQAVSTKKSELEQKQKDLKNAIRDVDSKADGAEALVGKLKIEIGMAKNDFKALKGNSYALDESFIHKFLDLPNDIHDRTPLEANEIYFSHSGPRSVNATENHLNKVNYVEYHDPSCYFLKGDAAKLDFSLPIRCMELFRSFGFISFSNPDFVKSAIAEGAGFHVDDLLTIVEENLENQLNRLHLAGSGSMLGFLGFVTKLLIHKKRLPFKLMSSGKNFSNDHRNATADGMYSVCQTTNVQVFGVSSSAAESLHQFDETLGQMIDFYKRLDRTFRVTYATSDQLAQAEELRAVFEMYSPHRKSFVPIGHLSSYGDYISKRLLIACSDDHDKQYTFVHLISGSVINVTTFIAIVLEESGVLKASEIVEKVK